MVLDSSDPFGDPLPLDLSTGMPLATYTFDVLPAAPVGTMVALDLAHRVFGRPPVASVLINEALDSLVPEIRQGGIRVVATSPFVRGECDGDGNVTLTDAVFILNFMFSGGVAPTCFDACDTNDSGKLDISDPVRILLFLFAGGSAPPSPFPAADEDPTADTLDCEVVP